VSPRVGLDDVENRKFCTLPGLELRPLGSPVAILTALSRLHLQRDHEQLGRRRLQRGTDLACMGALSLPQGSSSQTLGTMSGWQMLEATLIPGSTCPSTHPTPSFGTTGNSNINNNSLSIYGSTALLLDLGRFFSFLILYTLCRTPWTGDQPVARTHRTTQT
jgi:hypothetical protein